MKSLLVIQTYILIIGGCMSQQMNIKPFKPEKSFIFSPDVTINFESSGNHGPAVVFLHGYGASIVAWNDIRNKMPSGYKLFFIDLKGFGYSSKPKDKRYSLSDQADIVAKFIVDNKLKEVVLVGHSYGGGVALLTYMKFLENPSNPIKKMVLIDSAGYTFNFPFFIDYLRTPVINILILNLVPSKYRAEHTLKRLYCDQSKVTEEKVLRYSFFFDMPGSHYSFVQAAKRILPQNHKEIVESFKLISVPTLVIWGRNDPIIPLTDAYRFQADISRTCVRIIDECGHIPHEEKPEETAKIIADFLSQNDKTD
jgi:pimeloyl-ACP methyl ester carboxylesterase